MLVPLSSKVSVRQQRRLFSDDKLRTAFFVFLCLWFTVAVSYAARFNILSLISRFFRKTAFTPSILDTNKRTIPDSIGALEPLKLGGSIQWITIRGHDKKLPVVLYLAGGPGGSDLAWTRKYLSELEKYFIVVTWDQPGSAKSFHAVDTATLKPDRYLSDAYELTGYLLKRFEQSKIYLLGHSWGSLLGMWLIQRHPEAYHAYAGTGQVVNTVENDVTGYELACRLLEEKGDQRTLARLRKAGAPPYREGNVNLKYAVYATTLLKYMNTHARGESGRGRPPITLDMLRAPEYNLLDKFNYFRGAFRTFNHVYPQLEDVDLEQQVPRVDVPVYFALGRWDVNAMSKIAARYFETLDAPYKELVWFEKSGHLPHYEEPARFVQFMTERVLGNSPA
jgi:pimeloyl-ACP methyl ester carboxylesterase